MAIFLAYLVPPSILFIPLATIVFRYGLFNSPFALILTYPTFLIPFCTWLLMGYFRSIPYELEECALMDGASRLQILLKILLPLSVPGLISAGIFAFTLSWNEFIYALTFISSTENKTVPVGVLTELVEGDVYHWGALMTGALHGLAAGGAALLLLRRALRLLDDGGGEGVGSSDSLESCAGGRPTAYPSPPVRSVRHASRHSGHRSRSWQRRCVGAVRRGLQRRRGRRSLVRMPDRSSHAGDVQGQSVTESARLQRADHRHREHAWREQLRQGGMRHSLSPPRRSQPAAPSPEPDLPEPLGPSFFAPEPERIIIAPLPLRRRDIRARPRTARRRSIRASSARSFA